MYDDWKDLEESVKNCKKCELCQNRCNIVWGEGNKNADIMFIGEGPGADEDSTGVIFSGKSGKLMRMAFEGIGINVDKVYLTNIIKCRPLNNRQPKQNEIETCLNYLRNQVILIKPKIIVLLGNIALKSILGKDLLISEQRGKWIEKKGIMYFPTWHPAALLRDENKKIEFWKDLKMIKEKMTE